MLNHTESSQPLAGLQHSLNRRRFLQAAGVTAAAAGTLAVTGCGGVFGVDSEAGPAPSLEDVLNFALNLEYLESSFYLYITTGAGLQAADMGSAPGTVTGGKKINFTDPNVAALANQLAADEQAHVRFLRAGMELFGMKPVDMPSLNLAALGAPIDDASFLALSRQLETTGTSAYEGGVQYLASNVLAVEYAARIHAAEGEHEAVLRQFCILKNISSPAVDKYDHPPALTSTTIFNNSILTSLNTARNASEVLQIVYGAPGLTGISSGGFFPAGLNGNVKTS